MLTRAGGRAARGQARGGKGNRARLEEKNMGEREKLRRSQGRGSEPEREVGRKERAGREWAELDPEGRIDGGKGTGERGRRRL